MALAFQKGQTVALKVTPPAGPVMGFRVDGEGNVSYLVEWINAEGQTQQRWFAEDELQAV